MSTDAADLVRAATASARQHDAAAAKALQPLAPASKRLTMTIPIGTYVLDLVTGQKGVVVDGTIQNVVVPPATNAGS